jgi:hypothetical protein
MANRELHPLDRVASAAVTLVTLMLVVTGLITLMATLSA